MKSILIIGGSKSAYPFLLAARDKGYEVIVVDRAKSCFCSPHCDRLIELSTFDHASVYEEIQRKKLVSNICGILSYSSYPEALMTASFLSQRLDLPGFSKNSVKDTYDKSAINRILSDHNILVPERRYISDTAQNLLMDCQREHFPYVVKQLHGIGSSGTRIIENKEDLDCYMSDYKNSVEQFVIEEYVEGDLYHIDGYVQNGESCIFSGVKKLTIVVNGIPLTRGYIPCPEITGSSEHSELSDNVKRGLAALGVDNHFFGADVIINKTTGEFRLLEIGYLLDAKMDRLLYHAGVDVYAMLVDIVSGVEVCLDETFSIDKNKCLEFMYAECDGRLEISRDRAPGVEWEREEGDSVKVPSSISDILGWIIYDKRKIRDPKFDSFFRIR